jgi:hypothetical protein
MQSAANTRDAALEQVGTEVDVLTPLALECGPITSRPKSSLSGRTPRTPKEIIDEILAQQRRRRILDAGFIDVGVADAGIGALCRRVPIVLKLFTVPHSDHTPSGALLPHWLQIANEIWGEVGISFSTTEPRSLDLTTIRDPRGYRVTGEAREDRFLIAHYLLSTYGEGPYLVLVDAAMLEGNGGVHVDVDSIRGGHHSVVFVSDRGYHDSSGWHPPGETTLAHELGHCMVYSESDPRSDYHTSGPIEDIMSAPAYGHYGYSHPRALRHVGQTTCEQISWPFSFRRYGGQYFNNCWACRLPDT